MTLSTIVSLAQNREQGYLELGGLSENAVKLLERGQIVPGCYLTLILARGGINEPGQDILELQVEKSNHLGDIKD